MSYSDKTPWLTCFKFTCYIKLSNILCEVTLLINDIHSIKLVQGLLQVPPVPPWMCSHNFQWNLDLLNAGFLKPLHDFRLKFIQKLNTAVLRPISQTNSSEVQDIRIQLYYKHRRKQWHVCCREYCNCSPLHPFHLLAHWTEFVVSNANILNYLATPM